MNEKLKTAVARMSDIVAEAAPAMVDRIVKAIQSALALDAQLPHIGYCSLLLKVGAADVSREFLADLNKAAAKRRRAPDAPRAPTSVFGLWLEPMGEADPSVQIMQKSTGIFDRLVDKAQAQGIQGLEAYGKNFFLEPLREALVKARIDDENVTRIMPYACRALDAELASFYGRIEALG